MTTRTRMPTRLFNVDEYYAMADAGILTEDEHLELIDGRIYSRYEGKPRLFSVDEYYAMAGAGILASDERVELIHGEIIPMSPIGSRHASTVYSLDYWFSDQLRQRAHVRVQSPVRLGSSSEPEPDVAILKWRDDFYSSAHPGPDDILLIIEVCDTTLESDRAEKVPLYARFGIPETWLANIRERHVEVFSQPSDGEYLNSRIVGLGEVLTLPGFEDVSLPVNRIFPD
ncbi:MAG: Uma2 family endonuclease [Dehalococcoidia bacterium]|nr:Uma2 family endonuclease [Dehalococcoidia bacterium]